MTPLRDHPRARFFSLLKQTFDPTATAGRYAFGAAWSSVGAISAQGFGLLASVITARLLGRESFGELIIIQSTVGMFGVFAGAGMGLTATKFVAELRTRNPIAAGRVIGVSTLAAIITGAILTISLAFASPYLAQWAFKAASLSGLLAVSSALVGLNTVNGVQLGALAGLEAFRLIARLNAFRAAVSFVIVVVATSIWSLPGAVSAYILAALVTCVVTHATLRRELSRLGIRLLYRPTIDEWRMARDFSLPAFISGLLPTPAGWAANTILVASPSGYSELALFNVAVQWRTAILFFPSTFGNAILPILSSLRGRSARASQGRLMLLAMGVNVFFAAAVGGVVWLVSFWVLGWYGSGFRSASAALNISIWAAILTAPLMALGYYVVSENRMWLSSVLNGLQACSLVGIFLLKTTKSAYTLSCAHLISICLHFIALGGASYLLWKGSGRRAGAGNLELGAD